MAPNLLERQLLRTRNGLAHLAGARKPEVAQTPRDLVWRRETARLWRYRSEDRSIRAPLLIVHSLVSKSYILDLQPENSMLRFLVGEGFDVFLLDWEAPGAADAENTLETYSADLIPRALAAVCAEADAEELTLMGYCFGGDLVLLTAAIGAGVLPIRNVVTLTTPCDFRSIGFLADMFLEGRLDADDIIDDTGLVPAVAMDAGFQSIKPTDQLVQPLNLWDQLWNAERAENFLALYGWTRDQIAFPGALFRQTIDTLVRDNALASGEVPFAGAVARLSDIKRPFLNIFCDQDTIVPAASAQPLVGLVGSRDATELRLETGHVGLVAGRYAEEVARPAIADWIRRHSANRKTSTPKENGDRHTAGAAAA
jgi:poly[(R)-3-hydroxyalkanoate] polymerase subunit PhaC